MLLPRLKSQQRNGYKVTGVTGDPVVAGGVTCWPRRIRGPLRLITQVPSCVASRESGAMFVHQEVRTQCRVPSSQWLTVLNLYLSHCQLHVLPSRFHRRLVD